MRSHARRINEAVEAFALLYESLWRKEFRRSLDFNSSSERQLLPLTRTFLLGYFGESIVPEASAKLPGGLTGNGRVDFLIGDLAIEFVVRRSLKAASTKGPSRSRRLS